MLARLMRLGRFSFGYVVTVGIAAAIFLMVVNYSGKRFPQGPAGSIRRGIGLS